jgi:hypothetical protein
MDGMTTHEPSRSGQRESEREREREREREGERREREALRAGEARCDGACTLVRPARRYSRIDTGLS